jgi:hypothetical protein
MYKGTYVHIGYKDIKRESLLLSNGFSNIAFFTIYRHD